ncbi:MAG: hypothetical protein EXS16_02085 [Gemmataceae bacterium]|nr:hypothetical protein [Gemmataceae bacterium]
MHSRSIFRLFLIIVLAGCFFASAHGQTPRKPNLIFVLVDDMGYADLGCMGGKDAKTPNIDRLATEGVTFSQFYSNAPVCTPTRYDFDLPNDVEQRRNLAYRQPETVLRLRRLLETWEAEMDKSEREYWIK